MNDGDVHDGGQDGGFFYCACRDDAGACPPQCVLDCRTNKDCLEITPEWGPNYEGRRTGQPDAADTNGIAPHHGGCAGCAMSTGPGGDVVLAAVAVVGILQAIRRAARAR